ncbi:hypothetical protein RradSPS_1450 [Rubrobacter radiotolerans]|uniref:Segregation and condensation protein A n=1 Tax=Rubrobacter radiotolerans TaxID=42256 RepID=A0A023X316_RUBRA|nr:ScpA family protein [Rubrobacter radiotolerans]AHY46733.1 hypothetical protein RradSPS_1450 [Rubrobacter radiotolerans]MDX5894140.1 ScpA family protein [Rubrobacter radiotolerans]SMC05293.1 condensin subunit ScpA [Rubrobacter radiotolerans DSM 5868]
MIPEREGTGSVEESRAGRPLSGFTVELDVYSGPYEWLLALVLKDEVEIFEVPLKELIDLYLTGRDDASPDLLERDAEFASSASSLVLLKSRTLLPLSEPEPDFAEPEIDPAELAERLALYLKVRRGAEGIGARIERNAGYHATGHELRPKPGALRVDPKRLTLAARRIFSRLEEPSVAHLGSVTVTVQDLIAHIRAALSGRESLLFEDLTAGMDRLRQAVTFAAALSLAHEGSLALLQEEPLGPLTLAASRASDLPRPEAS